jgi:RecA/RadA recombinase
LRRFVPPSTYSDAPRAPALTRREGSEVLRYWLASLHLQEALAARPRARRPTGNAVVPRLDAPSQGHEYFKVALDDALASLLCKRTALHKPFDAELSGFFESWLATQYRRGEQEGELSHLVAFPVVHLPRGELAGLLRCGVQVRFGEAGAAEFRVPTRGQRRRREYPGAPGEARLAAIPRNGRQSPFFVDTRLLHQQLGVARESIDAFFAALRKHPDVTEHQMLGMICELLEREQSAEDASHSAKAGAKPDSKTGPADLFRRIHRSMQQLLLRRGGRARVYPVGIVLDGDRAKTTWHLQRELQLLLEDRPEVVWDVASSLGSYLTARAQPPASMVQRGLFPGTALSGSQRRAAERFWGSRLTAVQGPPGTGKTTLILHLCAEHLMRQVDALADSGAMGDALLVATSTNNRAVDNVVDPLIAIAGGGLALALRAGSQKVCEQLLSTQLAHTRGWLERAAQRPPAERAAELALALERFRDLRARLAAEQAPRARAFKLAAERERLRFELEGLEAEHAALDGGDQPPIGAEQAALLRAPLEKARRRLQGLCALCAAPPSVRQLSAIARHHRKSARRAYPALEDAITTAGLSLELGLPPDLPASVDPAQLMEAWEVAAEAALARLEALRVSLDRGGEDARRRARAATLRRRLNELGAQDEGDERDAPAMPGAEGEALQHALFEAAVAVREAWAASQAPALCASVALALDAARDERSLRPVWSRDEQAYRQLRQLFGLWGCTLLSLGNCFPAQRDGIERLIIDEAGQCHPAYAVGGLLRSRSALVIGDVHQLEPVIDLEPDDDERVIASCKLGIRAGLLEPYRIHNQAACSVQALADRAVIQRPRLIEHFRCLPEIIAICDTLCGYGLCVLTPPAEPMVRVPFLSHPVTLIDVPGEQERLGGSWCNPSEVAATVELVQALLSLGLSPEELAVITPYRGQLEQLHKHFARIDLPIDRSVEMLDIEDLAPGGERRGLGLGTVHRFQGGERQIVVFSSVVTRRASLAFLDDRENLLNVAVSRARQALITVGCRAVLEAGRRTRLLTRAAAPLEPEAYRQQLGLGL